MCGTLAEGVCRVAVLTDLGGINTPCSIFGTQTVPTFAFLLLSRNRGIEGVEPFHVPRRDVKGKKRGGTGHLLAT